jgi:DNA-3-methyladenine glycosylase II
MTTERQKILAAASEHLGAHDPHFVPIIKRFGTCTITPHANYYRELVNSIISQQLSVKAGATIFGRFLALFGGAFPTPEQILARDIDELRGVGMSRPKATYVRDLAKHIVDGELELDKISKLSNEKVIAELVDIKGIGEWTAHMFLIFSLGRLDVLATGDLGVRMAIMKVYRLNEPPSPAQMQKIAHTYQWHPFESVACWYLWQSLDNTPQTDDSPSR